jgi:hypothetical protein
MSAGGERESSPHSHKFLAATATLVGVAIGAVAVALAILLSGSRTPSQIQWSSWKPPDSGVVGEREIAAQVAPFYRATPAGQLVVVTVQNISDSASGTTGGGGTQIALRDPSKGTLAAVSGTTAVYDLCGLGPGCSIATGTPSTSRELLLRREALELALYTFKYINGVDNVAAILPPGRTTSGCTGICPTPNAKPTTKTVDFAVLFDRQSLQPFLDRPLRSTLPEPLPPTVAEMPGAPEAELVSVITGQALFQRQSIQAQDGSNVLVFQQLPPQ